MRVREWNEFELYEYLTKAIDGIVERRGKGAYTRGAVDGIQAIIDGMELRPGAPTTIIRDED
jgi:hypothetical protein